MRLYHRTSADAATAIIADGFIDGTGNYGTAHDGSGVWLSDRVLDGLGDSVIEVELDASVIFLLEVKPAAPTYREWFVPASHLNEKAKLRLVPVDELDQLPREGDAL